MSSQIHCSNPNFDYTSGFLRNFRKNEYKLDQVLDCHHLLKIHAKKIKNIPRVYSPDYALGIFKNLPQDMFPRKTPLNSPLVQMPIHLALHGPTCPLNG